MTNPVRIMQDLTKKQSFQPGLCRYPAVLGDPSSRQYVENFPQWGPNIQGCFGLSEGNVVRKWCHPC